MSFYAKNHSLSPKLTPSHINFGNFQAEEFFHSQNF